MVEKDRASGISWGPWVVSRSLHVITEQGDQGNELRASDPHPGASMPMPSKTPAHLLDNLISYCALLCPSPL